LVNAPRIAVERGIVYGGVVLPGTDFVLREPGAWWTQGERGTYEREGPPSVLVGHWTAGGAHEGPGTGKRVVRNMKARTRDDGTPLTVGIHFVIGWDGFVFQTCDLALAAVHVGSRGINKRSIGVETCWPGSAAQASRLGMQGHTRRTKVAGGTVDVMEPSPELVAAYVRLAETLAAHLPIPRQVPLDRDGRLLMDRMTPAQLRAWRGGIEHLHVPTTKVDAAGFLVGALRNAGWRGVPA
jgi:hypothetical protein